jgi:hypothetical protein
VTGQASGRVPYSKKSLDHGFLFSSFLSPGLAGAVESILSVLGGVAESFMGAGLEVEAGSLVPCGLEGEAPDVPAGFAGELGLLQPIATNALMAKHARSFLTMAPSFRAKHNEDLRPLGPPPAAHPLRCAAERFIPAGRRRSSSSAFWLKLSYAGLYLSANIV